MGMGDGAAGVYANRSIDGSTAVDAIERAQLSSYTDLWAMRQSMPLEKDLMDLHVEETLFTSAARGQHQVAKER